MENKTILIIEDDAFFRMVISKEFELKGFNIIGAANSIEAFKFLDNTIPDLILLDILLPGMNGYDILEKIKADKKTSGIPVVMLSNLGQKDEIEKAKNLGAEDFMIKVNFVPEEIVQRVREILNKKFPI
ncbi:MAG: response regulator [Patescibacteria group bacterium]